MLGLARLQHCSVCLGWPAAGRQADMATAPTQEQLRAALNYLNTSYGTAPSDAVLNTLRYYDPNASVTSSSGGDSGTVYGLNLDYSKLPGFSSGTNLGPSSAGTGTGSSYNPGYQTVNPDMKLNNPQSVLNGTPYGTVTQNSNISDNTTGLFRVLDKVIPYAVDAMLLYGGAQAAGSLLGGAGGGGLFSQAAAPVTDLSNAVTQAGAATGMAPVISSGLGSAPAVGLGAGTVGDGIAQGSFDRGLGTFANGATGAGTDGTLTAAQIAALGSGAAGSGLNLHNIANAISNAAKGITGTNSLLNGGGTGGAGGSAPSLSLGGGSSVAPDSMAMLRAFYAPKTQAHQSRMPVDGTGLLAGNPQMAQLVGLLQGGGYG